MVAETVGIAGFRTLRKPRQGLTGHSRQRMGGGNREGWERVPYWLDGFIPLSFLLRDGEIIARAKRFIDRILSFQQEDGWICPNGKHTAGKV